MKRFRTLAASSIAVAILTLSIGGSAAAHVTVKPGEVKTGAYQTFTVGVPTEKDVPTIGVKVEIPKGVASVTPTVKPGWTVEAAKQGSGHEATTDAITWTGGTIGAGLRDEFTFSAKTPADATELQWKAYQTYADGTVVEWNLAESQQPKKQDGSPDFSTSGPFSITKVVTETAQEAAIRSADAVAQDAKRSADRSLTLAIGGVVIAIVAIYLATRKAKP